MTQKFHYDAKRTVNHFFFTWRINYNYTLVIRQNNKYDGIRYRIGQWHGGEVYEIHRSEDFGAKYHVAAAEGQIWMSQQNQYVSGSEAKEICREKPVKIGSPAKKLMSQTGLTYMYID